ncbi:hypothetical protein [Devosia geojensis]|uniref:hypothetical protein n=1 Tax=Devosia geojensis TaxID=443610 RepID=UPI00069812D1|nr:hypothetical protein [Devosia geojensis]
MRQFCTAALLAALSVPCGAQELTPQAVRAMLDGSDAGAVVEKLNAGESPGTQWDALTDRIETGEAAWLDLVPLLKPGTDAGTAEELRIVLSRALAKNAVGVLALLANGLYPPEDICTSNEIEALPLDVAEAMDAALVAVAAVLDPPLRETRDVCLLELGETRTGVLVNAAHGTAD